MKTLTVKQRKKIARLKSELKKLEDKAYKMDGNDYYAEPFNSRYSQKEKELLSLQQLTPKTE